MITDYEDDAHFCLKCHTTIIGLDNYVNHRKAGCSKNNDRLPKSPLPSQFLQPDESFNLKADDFFSSLELRSSSKKNEVHSTSGKNFSGILTRSKTTAAIQANSSKDPNEQQQSKSGKNVWIGGHQLKALGDGDNQSKLVEAVDNLERRKEEPTKIQVYEESDDDSEEYEYDDDDSSSDDHESPPRHHTGGKWKPTSPISWSRLPPTESRDWNVPPPTYTGGKWKPSKRPSSPSYGKGKWKPEPNDDDSIPPPTFTGSKWVASKKQEYQFVPPPNHTKGKWKPRLDDDDDDVPPPNYTKGKWKPKIHNEEEISQQNYKLKSRSDLDQKFPPPGHTKGKWKPKSDNECQTSKSKINKSKIDNFPPPDHTKGKWKPKEIVDDDTEQQKNVKSKSNISLVNKTDLKKFQETKQPSLASISKQDNSFLRKSNGKIQYWCSPCNRRLASKIVYERHLKSELHFKRTLHDREFDDGEEINFLKEAGRTKIKPPETIFSTQDQTSFNATKKKKRKKTYLRCDVCQSKVNKYLIGKHLVSHYHCRKGDITTPLARKMVLDNIHPVVLETPFQCSICKFYCNTEEDFLKHWRSEYHKSNKSPGYYFCMLCKYKSEDTELMHNHLISEEHTEVVSVINRSVPIVIKKISPIKCLTCHEEFTLNIQLLKHCEKFNHDASQVKKAKMEFVCEKCGKAFLKNISLMRHKKKIHKERYYTCSRCKLLFDNAQSALAHRRSTQHKYKGLDGKSSLQKKCAHCNKFFNNFLLLKEHLSSKHPDQKVRCPQCGATFTVPQELTTHLRLKQCKFEPSSNVSSNRFKCEKCPFSSNSYSEILFHVALHQEPLQISTDTTSNSKPTLRYKCSVCDKLFPKSSLLGHIRQHTNERPFVCKICGKGFARKNNLQYHLNIHSENKEVKKVKESSGEKPYLCSTCGSSFKSRWILQQHMFVHTGKVCKCPNFGCLYTARKQSEVDAHFKTHLDVREFQCDLCEYKGKTKQLLTRHMLVHTGIKKYQCLHCSFTGRNSTDIKRHGRIHTGAKPFNCPHCDYKCNNLENLRKHILSTNKHPGKSIYECKFCDFRDNFAKNFKTHLMLEHPDTFTNAKEASSFIAGIYEYQFDNTQVHMIEEEEQEENHGFRRENTFKLKTSEDPIVCQIFNQPSTSKEQRQLDQMLPMFIINKEECPSDSWNLVGRYDVEEVSGTLIPFQSDSESLFEGNF